MMKATVIIFTIMILAIAIAIPTYILLIANNTIETTTQTPPTNQPTNTANYRVTFHSTWTPQTHPTNYPTSAHFSPLVLASHNQQGTLFQENQQSTEGIEIMAETGGTGTLTNEIKQLQQNNNALDYKTGNVIFLNSQTSMNPLTIQVSQEHPLITAVTMIAPSPDWFVAIQSINLYENNQWVESLRINGSTYDAGTESGETFSMSNPETNPQQTITKLTTGPLATNGKIPTMGYFEIQRTN